jgi:hypothetical protein
MSQRIKQVPGGYRIVHSIKEVIIPAHKVIPFGIKQPVSHGALVAKKINLESRGEDCLDEHERKLDSEAKAYADRMKAQFYEFFPEHRTRPGRIMGFQRTTVFSRAEVQLYVENPNHSQPTNEVSQRP